MEKRKTRILSPMMNLLSDDPAGYLQQEGFEVAVAATVAEPWHVSTGVIRLCWPI